MYDTLSSVTDLVAVGIPREQAEAQVKVMSNLVDKSFATKTDLREAVASLRAEMAQLRAEMDVKFAIQNRDLTIRMGLMTAASTTLTISVLSCVIALFMHR